MVSMEEWMLMKVIRIVHVRMAFVIVVLIVVVVVMQILIVIVMMIIIAHCVVTDAI